jgi:tRNA-Thr(GGU) m(6)t(6)A37 methyltransferase TsaA
MWKGEQDRLSLFDFLTSGQQSSLKGVNMEATDYLLRPVAIVKSDRKEPSLVCHDKDLNQDQQTSTGRRWRRDVSEIVVEERYKECLDGIEDFSHIMVIYWSHKAGEGARNIKKVHPAGKKDYPLKGVFCTRSPIRPNPVCVTTVELIERKGEVLVVRGLDAIDGSPVIDIKPHLPTYDAPSHVKLSDWMESLMEYFSKEGEKEE